MEFDLPDSSILYSPKDITSTAPGVTELPYVSASTGPDITGNKLDNQMLSEITKDPLQIFVDVDGRIAIRLDNQIINILD